MTKVLTNQALERWDTLPVILREALYSEPNSDFLWKTCEAEHIPDNKIYAISKITGYVLMGFLHPEDVADEIRDTLGIDQKTSMSIQIALNQRIFAPLRKEIDGVYSPLSLAEVGPKIVSEIRPPAPPAPKMMSETFTAMPKIATTPISGKPMTMPGQPAPIPSAVSAPAPTPNQGWSKQSPQAPIVKLGTISPAAPGSGAAQTQPFVRQSGAARPVITPSFTPQPAATPPSYPPISSAPKPITQTPPPAMTAGSQRGMSEFERLDLAKKSNAGIPVQPAPMMIHQTDPVPLPKNSTVQLGMDSRDQLTVKTPQQTPMPGKAAVLELGNVPKVVHYSEYKTTTPPAMPLNTGPRQINEVTTPLSSIPPSPSRPPMPQAPAPSPTSTPATPPGKVIVQDFLEPKN